MGYWKIASSILSSYECLSLKLVLVEKLHRIERFYCSQPHSVAQPSLELMHFP